MRETTSAGCGAPSMLSETTMSACSSSRAHCKIGLYTCASANTTECSWMILVRELVCPAEEMRLQEDLTYNPDSACRITCLQATYCDSCHEWAVFLMEVTRFDNLPSIHSLVCRMTSQHFGYGRRQTTCSASAVRLVCTIHWDAPVLNDDSWI